MSPLLVLLLSLLSVVSARHKCEDGVDNAVHLSDAFNGEKYVVLEDFVLLFYNDKKKPSCVGEGKATIQLPGYFRFKSGKIVVKESVPIKGAMRLGFSLKKNSFLVGEVCSNGKSVNSFVSDDMCAMDIFQLAPASVWKQFQKEGVYDVESLPGSWTEMKKLVPHENPYIEGEWEVSAKLSMGGEHVAGFSFGSGWVDVATTARPDPSEEL